MSAIAVALALGLGSAGGWTAAHRSDLEGWRAAEGGSPPEYVEEAAESRQATRVREAMVSQPETANLDAAEIRRTLQVSLPRLPHHWRIRNVQIFPTDEGPAVTVVVEAAGRRMELFAVRAQTSVTERPRIATRGPESVVYWERGDDAYVLSGAQSKRELMLDATALAQGAQL